ncbi:MAG: HDOD domain-containing protein [Treponema sp.]|nr:HDOD domain-containing protein [Treponema sp.]
MMQENYDKKIDEYINKMPSLPMSIAKVLEICNNVNVSPADLNYVISLDPVLVGRVLKLLNSAYYGLSQKVTNLVRAIIMLGINTVKNLTLSTAVLATLPVNKSLKGLNMEGFWRHSLCVGVTAKILAKKRGIDSKFFEEYFTAGLLHDIGKIPLNAVLSADYLITITSADREQLPLFEAEKKSLGFDHCDAGRRIVDSWKLDGPVADAIIYHHDLAGYSGDYHDILSSVAVANYFASIDEIGFSGSRHPEKPAEDVWNDLGINEDIFEEVKIVVNDEIEKAKVFLNF